MKPDFEEELKHFNIIINEVNNDMNYYQRIADSLKKEVEERRIVDYDGADAWKQARNRYIRSLESVLEYKTIKKEPYHGRFDLEEINTNGEIHQYYIGKQSYFHDGKQRVVDWRTDLGNYYYQSDVAGKEFRVKGIDYSMVLKRSIDIKNAKLRTVDTIFDAYSADFDSDVVDSFLIKVLKDKRRDRKLTDIIRTIQDNQNRILRQPKDINFILQGCAGSGKTMILLHRLSYILFNEMYKPDEILVVTPNKLFDSHIDDLSKELGLRDIKRITVDEYYQELISNIIGRKFSTNVLQENNLNEFELESIYSSSFAYKVFDIFSRGIDDLNTTMDDEDIRDIMIKSGQEVLQPSIDNFAVAINKLDFGLREIDSVYTVLKNVQKAKNNNDKLINDSKNALSTCKKNLIDEEAKIISYIDSLISEEEKLQKQNDDNNGLLSELNNELKSKSIDLNKAYSLDHILSKQDDCAKYLYDKTIGQIESINELKHQLSKTSSFNFLLRNKLNNDIKNAEHNLRNIIDKAIEEYNNELSKLGYQDEINKLTSEIANVNKIINVIKKEKEDKNSELDSIKDRINRINNPKTSKDVKDIIDLLDLDLMKRKEIDDIVSKLETSEEKVREIGNQIRLIKSKNHNILSLKSYEFESIRKFRTYLKKYEFSSFEKQIYDKLTVLPANNEGVKGIYRYQLYIKLLASSLYFARPKLNYKLICFDEAQDLSPSEYELFIKLNRNDCVYNLYGDTKQAMHNYERIDKWEDINRIQKMEHFVLNQNYRNTMQITEYCNKQFDTEIIPIGVNGESEVIEEYEIYSALEKIKKIKNDDLTKRCTVIYSDNNVKMKKALEYFATVFDFDLDIESNEKVSILPVSMIKGLEFDAVVVVDEGMSKNEKYISYTRALDNLIISHQSS